MSLAALLVSAAAANAQNVNVTVDPSALTLGYMNWQPTTYTLANYPTDGGTGGSSWGLSALQANFSGTTLTLQPNINTYAAGVGYWTNPDGTGANQMDANIYNETTGTYVNTTLTFSFDVTANSLTAPYTAQAFIKDFNSTYSSYTQQTVALTMGMESVTFATSANAGDHIQYGFEMFGPDAAPGSSAANESVVITPVTAVPEPAVWTWAGSGGALILALVRRGRKS